MSLMYSKKSIGPRTEPCGTPDVTSVMSDRAPFTETRCLRFDRKYVIQLCVLPVIPFEFSLDRRRLCSEDFIKSFSKIEEDYINLCCVIQCRHPVMDCLY